MARKFVKATGLHNIFNTSGSTLDITSIKESVQSKVNQNSIVFLTASEDASYGYPNDSKYIWTMNTLYPTNDPTIDSDIVESIPDVSLFAVASTPVVDKTSESSNVFALDPNKMYMFGTRTNLTVTLNPGNSDIVNEYTFQFTSGSTATTLNVPSSVTWLKDPDIQSGKKYAVSIENNLGIIGEWNNE